MRPVRGARLSCRRDNEVRALMLSSTFLTSLPPLRHFMPHGCERVGALGFHEPARLRKNHTAFEGEMAVVHARELSDGICQEVRLRSLVSNHFFKQRLKRSPDQANLFMVLHQLVRGAAQRPLSRLAKQRDNVLLLVLMMQRRRDGEVTQNVERRLPRPFIGSMARKVPL